MNEVRAFPVTLVETTEPLRAVRELAREWMDRPDIRVEIQVWDPNAGVRSYDDWARGTSQSRGSAPTAPAPPLAAVHELGQSRAQASFMIAINFHYVLKSPQVVQALLDGCREWSKSLKRFIIIAPPGTAIPPEIERYVVVIDHGLPEPEDLAKLVRSNAEANLIVLSDDEITSLARLGRGLTSFEFVNALALSIAEHGTIKREAVAAQKEQLVKKDQVLEWSRSNWTFESVGGLERIKSFLASVVHHPLSKGVLCLGVPGVGKTMIAQALANEVGLPALSLEIGQVMGSLVGESEAKMARALKVIDAMAPCVLVIDEIEKGLGGAASSHRTDGGTTARVFGQFLKWLNDRPTEGVFVVATCNDIDKMPPEFIRAERWDALFFFDLPNDAERDVIARLYAEAFDVELEPRADVPGWTGAEIKSVYRIAAMMGVSALEAAEYVTPLADTMREKIEALRHWARGRTVPASYGNGGEAVVETVRQV